MHARVLLLLLAPDAAREVLHQGLVLRAKLRTCNGATVDAGFRVKTATSALQIEQDTLSREGGVVRQVVAGEEGGGNDSAHLAVDPSLQIAPG